MHVEPKLTVRYTFAKYACYKSLAKMKLLHLYCAKNIDSIDIKHTLQTSTSHQGTHPTLLSQHPEVDEPSYIPHLAGILTPSLHIFASAILTS